MSRPNSKPLSPVRVTPSYSYLSDRLRRLSSGSLQCSLFCGGRGCKYESGEKWKEEDKAVGGLFSHWVTPNILAMARPSTHCIRNENLIAEFKRCGIKSVINLELPWEHAKCGPGIEQSSGFTYRPEDFMNNGVFYYNYGWMDYGVPTLRSLLGVVKVMDFALSEGKVAVHCHAGLGRTGVLIACYLAYTLRLPGPQLVAMVREKRPGSIQTRPQIEVVHEFASFLTPLWTFFPTPLPSTSGTSPLSGSPSNHTPSSSNHTPSSSSHTPLGLDDLIRNQSLLFHGDQERNLKDIPRVVDEVCGRLAEVSHTDESFDYSVLLQSLESWSMGQELSSEEQLRVDAMKVEMNTSLKWDLLHSELSPSPLLYLLSSFLSSLKEPLLCSSSKALEVLSHSSSPSHPRDVTALRIADTFRALLSAACEATPTSTSRKLAPPLVLYRKVAVRLLTCMCEVKLVTSGTETCGTSAVDTLLRYWAS